MAFFNSVQIAEDQPSFDEKLLELADFSLEIKNNVSFKYEKIKASKLIINSILHQFFFLFEFLKVNTVSIKETLRLIIKEKAFFNAIQITENQPKFDEKILELSDFSKELNKNVSFKYNYVLQYI